MVTRYKGLLGDAVPDDWTHRQMQRWDQGDPDTDHPMIVQPTDDPGYAMPNPPEGNLNAMPGVEVPGWLPVSVLRSLQGRW